MKVKIGHTKSGHWKKFINLYIIILHLLEGSVASSSRIKSWPLNHIHVVFVLCLRLSGREIKTINSFFYVLILEFKEYIQIKNIWLIESCLAPLQGTEIAGNWRARKDLWFVSLVSLANWWGLYISGKLGCNLQEMWIHVKKVVSEAD